MLANRIPPPTKGYGGVNDVGYGRSFVKQSKQTKRSSFTVTFLGIYDLWDLGEFSQKGTVRTKYGLKGDLVNACQIAREHGTRIYADVVFNHKAGADGTEVILAHEVAEDNRSKAITDPYEIEGWTKFKFEARGGKYSKFEVCMVV